MATLNNVEYSGPGWSTPPELWPTAVAKRRNKWDTTPEDSGMTIDEVREILKREMAETRAKGGDFYLATQTIARFLLDSTDGYEGRHGAGGKANEVVSSWLGHFESACRSLRYELADTDDVRRVAELAERLGWDRRELADALYAGDEFLGGDSFEQVLLDNIAIGEDLAAMEEIIEMKAEDNQS
jgi:hypothetical protein